MIETYVQQGKTRLRSLLADKRVILAGKAAEGFALSAASLRGESLPLVLGAVCGQSGWAGLAMALGGAAGYMVFWHQPQGIVWAALGLLLGWKKKGPVPAMAAAVTAVCALVFRMLLGDTAPYPVFVLRVAFAGVSAWCFLSDKPYGRWGRMGLGVLALAQIVPLPYGCLGFFAGAALAAGESFPAAALAGLALDLAQVTPVPMTAVLALAWCARLLPGKNLRFAAPALLYGALMAAGGSFDLYPLPALALGGLMGLAMPQGSAALPQGPVGAAQVRLELAADVLSRFQQQMVLAQLPPIDEEAIVSLAAERACGACPCRKTCRERDVARKMPVSLLRSAMPEEDVPLFCKKTGRILQELRRGQAQLRQLEGLRARTEEYRSAAARQYRFLSRLLLEVSDSLSQPPYREKARYTAQVAVYTNREPEASGDRWAHFPGVGEKYYVLLCDGMGTGQGAAEEGAGAVQTLKKLLAAGYPPEEALESLNSLYVLLDAAGAATVDLAELELSSGRAAVYKWGAAESVLLTADGAEKIGTATPPPGLSETDRAKTERLSLRRGETLFLLSDGVGGEDALHCCQSRPDALPGELANDFLERGSGADDKTVISIRLIPAS